MHDYKEVALDLARRAGAIMKKHFTVGMQKQWKADSTPVTEADLAINQLVIDTIRQHFPTHSILAEEGSHEVKDSEYIWVCDPVDGTVPFSLGIPTCAFSLALTHDGKPILGVVYDPFIDRMFVAEKGKGAFLNDKRIHVSKEKHYDKSVISLHVGKSTIFDSFLVAKELTDRGVKIMSHWSIVYPAIFVASGDLMATILRGTTPWDAAATALLVTEAGGKVTDLLGNEQRYDQTIKGCLFSNGLVHDEIVHMIKKSLQ